MEQPYNLITIVKENWAIIVTLAVAIFGLTNWVFRIYQIRKFRIEIHLLKEKLRNENRSSIEIATLDEIAKYADKSNSVKKVRTFINMKAEKLIEDSNLNEPGYEGVEETSLALTNIENSDFSIFVQIIPSVLFIAIMPLAMLRFFDWIQSSDSVIAQVLNSLLEVIGTLIIAVLVILYTYQLLEWIYEKISPKE